MSGRFGSLTWIRATCGWDYVVEPGFVGLPEVFEQSGFSFPGCELGRLGVCLLF